MKDKIILFIVVGSVITAFYLFNDKKEIKKEHKTEVKKTKIKSKKITYKKNRMFKYYNNTKYDVFYSIYFKRYFPEFSGVYSFRLIKAQSIQESLLNPKAKSYVGARGLMQFMPRTEKQVLRELKITKKDAALNPKLAIMMGCYYDRKMFNIWKNKNRKINDRFSLTFASYNAGAGNLLKAQKRCLKNTKGECNSYKEIEGHLHLITGRYSKETKTYVKRIWRYYKEMEVLK